MKIDLAFTFEAPDVLAVDLWDVFTAPLMIEQWLCKHVENSGCHTYTLDFDEGGGAVRSKIAKLISVHYPLHYKVELHDPGYPDSTVKVDIVDETLGAKITLTHFDVPEELAEGYTSGWKQYLACAVSLATSRRH